MTTTPTTRVGWTVDDSTFGARLALVRQKMDWNIKEAARECGLPAASWRTWERVGVSPRNIFEIVAVIADRTGCDYGWLLDAPRLAEGRTVVTGGEARRQTTVAKLAHTERSRPNGHPHQPKAVPSTRRTVRLSRSHT